MTQERTGARVRSWKARTATGVSLTGLSSTSSVTTPNGLAARAAWPSAMASGRQAMHQAAML